MKKITAFFCCKSNPNVKLPCLPSKFSKGTLERHSKQVLEQPSQQFLWAQKFPNCYYVSGAKFLSDGNYHTIMISFEGEEGIYMKFLIDDVIIHEVNIKEQHQGEFELHANDGVVIDCQWNLSDIPRIFKFYTRKYISSQTRTIGSSSHGGGDDNSLEQLDSYYHIHFLEIRGPK